MMQRGTCLAGSSGSKLRQPFLPVQQLSSSPRRREQLTTTLWWSQEFWHTCFCAAMQPMEQSEGGVGGLFMLYAMTLCLCRHTATERSTVLTAVLLCALRMSCVVCVAASLGALFTFQVLAALSATWCLWKRCWLSRLSSNAMMIASVLNSYHSC
jgi:hypothetical protein